MICCCFWNPDGTICATLVVVVFVVVVVGFEGDDDDDLVLDLFVVVVVFTISLLLIAFFSFCSCPFFFFCFRCCNTFINWDDILNEWWTCSFGFTNVFHSAESPLPNLTFCCSYLLKKEYYYPLFCFIRHFRSSFFPLSPLSIQQYQKKGFWQNLFASWEDRKMRADKTEHLEDCFGKIVNVI